MMTQKQLESVAGWRFIIHHRSGHHPGESEVEQSPTEFMDADRDRAAAAARLAFEALHPTREVVSVEWTTPIFKGLGWGDGTWTEGFK
jgi:hypothetical protein